MKPSDIVTYCKLHQIQAGGEQTAKVRFWVPGKQTESGKTRLFDRRGPSVVVIEQRNRDGNADTPEILVELQADVVIREIYFRLRKEKGSLWTDRTTAEVRAAAEIVVIND